MCIAPTGPIDQLDAGSPNENVPNLNYTPFEDPRPKKEPLKIAEPPASAPPLIRYFVDGSMRTCSAGHIVDPKGKYLPIFIGQIGVAVLSVIDKFPHIEDFVFKKSCFCPTL